MQAKGENIQNQYQVEDKQHMLNVFVSKMQNSQRAALSVKVQITEQLLLKLCACYTEIWFII